MSKMNDTLQVFFMAQNWYGGIVDMDNLVVIKPSP